MSTQQDTGIRVRIKLDKGAKMPVKAHPNDVGYDLFANDIQLGVCEHGVAHVKIDTGVHVQPVSDDYYIEVVPNSRISKTPFVMANSVGIIDPGYTGSIKITYNIPEFTEAMLRGTSADRDGGNATGNELPSGTLLSGALMDAVDKAFKGACGQLIVKKRENIIWDDSPFVETERGDGGFGSTARGKNNG